MKRPAFTLVELLVVISIIGLISTIAIVSMNSSKDKARVAAAKQFAAQMDRVGGDTLVGQWDLDEGAGTTAADLSGLKNNGTLTGGPTWSSDTPSGSGKSISVTATSYVSIPDTDALDIGTGSATRSLWFKTSQADRGIIFRKSDAGGVLGLLCDIGNGSAGVVKCFLDAGSWFSAAGVYNDGLWHHLACVINRTTNLLSIYIDGKQRGSWDISYAASNLNATSLTYIGFSAQGFVGLIDSVHAYSSALAAMDIRKMYLAERQNKLTAINK